MLTAHDTYRKSVASLMLILWALLVINDLCNRHYHIDENGNVISHVHFSDQPAEDHQHSDEELLWLEIISNPHVQLSEAKFFLSADLLGQISTKLPVFNERINTFSALNSITLRGPPHFN
ncbi:MAG: hypothetical protein LAT68_04465 [Cyclobacteriaceae bacterium]|nr:hypothetical protein [Cyclobacteriaceae bacterium]MCH8515563.1 hypothetical protein [Cyclobacteriaceae bacterium]